MIGYAIGYSISLAGSAKEIPDLFAKPHHWLNFNTTLVPILQSSYMFYIEAWHFIQYSFVLNISDTPNQQLILLLPGMLIVQRYEGYMVDLCGPSAGLYAQCLKQNGSSSLMNIHIIGPNLHIGPQAPPPSREWSIQIADLTEDAAT